MQLTKTQEAELLQVYGKYFDSYMKGDVETVAACWIMNTHKLEAQKAKFFLVKKMLLHSSFPDTKTDEGQNIGIDRIAEENQLLREEVKRRTIELEHKNRDLEIEAALERVRARTMAMQQPSELADTAAVLFSR